VYFPAPARLLHDFHVQAPKKPQRKPKPMRLLVSGSNFSAASEELQLV